MKCPKCKSKEVHTKEKRICYSDDSNGDPFMVTERWVEFTCKSCKKEWSTD